YDVLKPKPKVKLPKEPSSPQKPTPLPSCPVKQKEQKTIPLTPKKSMPPKPVKKTVSVKSVSSPKDYSHKKSAPSHKPPIKSVQKKPPSMPEYAPAPVEQVLETRIITKVKIDYSSAYLLADFINNNIRSNLAVAQNPSELILAGNETEILTAKQVVKLLDTCPKVQVFNLAYIRPVTMANMLANSVFGGDCCVCPDGCEFKKHSSPFVIYYNNEQNTITIVGASPKQMELADSYIKLSDLKSPQAFLDILIVEFNDWGISQFQKLAQFHIFPASSECGVSAQNLFSSISEIICNGGGEILARPKLTVSNDGNYQVNATSDQPVANAQGDVCNVEHNCGTRLKIHSVINQQGEVFLTLEPQYVAMRKYLADEKNPESVLFDKRSMKLENIRLEDGQTLCFGGMNTQEEYSSWGRTKVINKELMMFVNVHLQQ
ncbi:MAG: hypothetical protein PHE78_06780, partial [Candidatus Gastranaerophilales bacterium]|nr:hypothetical protein [Candidatus Gastranaerophilales bacterium]